MNPQITEQQTEQFQHLSINLDKQNIAWLCLNVANQSANILSPEVITELIQSCDTLNQLAPSGLIIYSGKRSGFIAGADIKGFVGVTDETTALKFIQLGQQMCDVLEKLPFPTLAMINGFCLGGGLELALACDYIVASESPACKLALPEVKLGIHPGFGGSVRLIRRIGVLKAMPMMLSGKNIPAKQAAKMRLVDFCVPARQLENTALNVIIEGFDQHKPAKQEKTLKDCLLQQPMVRKLLAKKMRQSTSQHAKLEHYPAPYALIDVWEKQGANNDKMYQAEAKSVSKLIQTETAQNLVRVFFLQNRLKAMGDKSLFTPRHVHVIGGGVMGGDIATWCAMQGMKVTLQDMNTEALAKVKQRADRQFKRRYRKDYHRIQSSHDHLIPDEQGHGIAKADVIIEAVFENLEVKQNIFKTLESKANPKAILASNTSSIRLEDIAKVMQQPERLLGLHFFNPVAKMPLLEIVHVPRVTANDNLQRALSFAAHINKLPMVVKSSPGFLVNRILVPYLLEAVTLYQEQVPAEVIDNAATDFGMPMGPLELADTVGLDICLHVGEILSKTLGYELPQALVKEVEEGLLGKKSGKGFYVWHKGKPAKAKQTNWQGDKQQIQERLISKLLVEAEKCLQEKIVEDVDLLDAGTIFGTGFAPFRGGPLHYLRSVQS